MSKPNIIMFVPDSYRGDVQSHLGNPAAVTPNLDALVAADGVSYANAFAQNPVCTPSRCSFMTGWYPHVHGHRSMINMLKPHEPNLLSVLRREGYYVAWAGKNDLVALTSRDEYYRYCDELLWGEPELPELHAPSALSADDPRGPVFYRGVRTSQGDGPPTGPSGDACYLQGALDFLARRPKDKPFCLYMPLTAPHPAYITDEWFYSAIAGEQMPKRIPDPQADANLPAIIDALRDVYGSRKVSELDWTEIRRVYYAMCSQVDAYFGALINALKQHDLYDSSLIMFFSDHGDFAGDYGLPEKTHATCQDSLVRVPLVIKPPAGTHVEAGVRNHLTELVDVTATIYDLLEIDPGYDSQGKSLRHSLAGKDTECRDAVFAEVGMRHGEPQFINPQVHAMAPDSFYARQSRGAMSNHERGSYAVMCRTHEFKLVRRPYQPDQDELYDLRSDPGETRNLAGRDEYADIENRLNLRLLDYFLATCDVLPREQDSRGI